jgi:hypothetical protein
MLFLFTFVAGAGLVGWKLVGATLGTGPQALSAARWDETYKGEAWVKVEGWVSGNDLQWQKKATDHYVGYVPIHPRTAGEVDRGEKERVRVVLELEGATAEELEHEVKVIREARKAIEGIVVQGDDRPAPESLGFADDVVVLRWVKR